MILPRRRQRRRPGAVAIALYLNAALLGGILLTMLTRDGAGWISLLPAARAAEGPAMGGAGNLYVIPGQFAERRYGCYLMDTDAQTLCVYQFEGSGQKLKLIAARNFRHDRRMGHLNTEPDPKEVEAMVEAERAGNRRAGGDADGRSPEAIGSGAPAAPKSRSNPN